MDDATVCDEREQYEDETAVPVDLSRRHSGISETSRSRLASEQQSLSVPLLSDGGGAVNVAHASSQPEVLRVPSAASAQSLSTFTPSALGRLPSFSLRRFSFTLDSQELLLADSGANRQRCESSSSFVHASSDNFADFIGLESIFKHKPAEFDNPASPKKEVKYSPEQAKDMAQGFRHIAWYVLCLAVVDYSVALLLYFLAVFNFPLMGFMENAIIIVFTILACVVELAIYFRTVPRTVIVEQHTENKCCGIPIWLWNFATFAPNYMQILTTACVAGMSFGSYTSKDAFRFAQHWSYVPLIGPFVGDAGIPLCLSFFLISSCALHLCMILYYTLWFYATLPRFEETGWVAKAADVCADMAEMVDAANLQFLGVAFRTCSTKLRSKGALDDYKRTFMETKCFTRLCSCLFIKLPMLWLKISRFSLDYDSMCWQQWYLTFFAIMLSWYGILQLVPRFFQNTYVAIKHRDGLAKWSAVASHPVRLHERYAVVLIIPLMLLLFHQGAHFVGVFRCPGHDLSLLKRGCS